MNHSANFFAPLLVFHAPQYLTMLVSGGRVAALPNALFAAKLEKVPRTPAATLPGLSLGRVWDSMWQLCLLDSLGAQGSRLVLNAVAGISIPKRAMPAQGFI